MSLVLSLFPGIGLLDRAFEEEGFCVVRGPDLLWGGEIKTFHPPAGVFDGVIGGPPCQRWSTINQLNAGRGRKLAPDLIPDFERVIVEAGPAWFVMENVPKAPVPAIDGYIVEHRVIDNRWLGEVQQRKRRWSLGSAEGHRLLIEFAALDAVDWEPAVTKRATVWDKTRSRPRTSISNASVRQSLRLQGLPENLLDDAPFTVEGKQAAIGNGVPLPMGRAIAKAVRRSLEEEDGQGR